MKLEEYHQITARADFSTIMAVVAHYYGHLAADKVASEVGEIVMGRKRTPDVAWPTLDTTSSPVEVRVDVQNDGKLRAFARTFHEVSRRFG